MKWLLKLFRKSAAPSVQATRPAPALTPRPVEPAVAIAPPADAPEEVWAEAICQAADTHQALAWLSGRNGDSLLGQVAMLARRAEVRLAAAQRISGNETLEQVAQASRSKDKRVYRHCTDLLRQRQQVDSCTRRVQAIDAELHGLLADSAPLPLSRLIELKHDLAGLQAAGEAFQECSALMARAHDRLHLESEQRRQLQTRLASAAALEAETAQAAWPWSEQLDAWRSRHQALSQGLAELPPWLNDQAARRALATSLETSAAHLAQLADETARFAACEQFLNGLDSASPVEAQIANAWKALAKPGHPAAQQALAARWQALPQAAPTPVVRPAEAPAAAPRPPASIDSAALNSRLDALEAAIGEGHLADADGIAKQVKHLLTGHTPPSGQLATRLHAGLAQLETLRGWARWSTGQAREQLIDAAQALLEGDHEVDALGSAIRDLRTEWQRLNAHAPASQALWESFNTTLEKAYEPVAAWRAAEATRQAEARAAREALCATWAAELAAIVWAEADFKAIEARRAEWLKQWHAAPQAGFRNERGLRKPFDALIEEIDQHLETARAAELERREQLIAQAEALQQQTDLSQAMSQAKTLQGRWTREAIPVRLKRSQDQQLWQRFRSACNAVFERREAQRSEQAAQLQELSEARRQRLDAFAASLESADANGIRQALSQFRADWVSSPADPLESRALDLQRRAQLRLDALRHAQYRERFELLANKAELASRIEAAALAGEPLDSILAATRDQWNSLPALPGKTEAMLASRLANAEVISRAQLDAGHELRQALLLDLEIALDLASPASEVERRRERQLARLKSRFGAAENPAEPAELLARWYATPALPDAAMTARIVTLTDHLVNLHSRA